MVTAFHGKARTSDKIGRPPTAGITGVLITLNRMSYPLLGTIDPRTHLGKVLLFTGLATFELRAMIGVQPDKQFWLQTCGLSGGNWKSGQRILMV